jgi:hypothetical protein
VKIELTLPLPPNRGNARWHWRTENRKKGAYWQHCDVFRMGRDFPTGWPNGTPEKVRVRVTLYVWNRMDVDNLMARLKWPLDWLEAYEYIPDDGPSLEWAGMPEQEIDRKNPRIEIALTAAHEQEGER